MLILNTDKISGIISYGFSYPIDKKETHNRLVFHVGITIQINGKSKTFFADISTISAKANKELEKEYILEDDTYCFENVTDLRLKMNILTDLGYGPIDYKKVRSNVRQYISSFYKEFTK